MSKIYYAFKEYIKDEEILKDIVNNVKTTSKAVSLLYNIKKYGHIKTSLENRELDAIYFATKMTPEEMTGEKKIEITNTVDEDQPDGLFKCENCKSMKTDYYQVHNIETTITYITCNACSHKWKT